MSEKDEKKDVKDEGVKLDPGTKDVVPVAGLFPPYVAPGIEIRVLSAEEEKRMNIRREIRTMATGVLNPKITRLLSETQFMQFTLPLEEKTTDSLPVIPTPLPLKKGMETEESNRAWLAAYSPEARRAALPKKEQRLLAGETFVVFTPEGKEDEYAGNVDLAAGNVFMVPNRYIYGKIIPSASMPYVDDELVSMVALNQGSLAKAEAIARTIRENAPWITVIFLYTNKEAADYGKEWETKISQLQENKIFDGFINLDRDESIENRLYMARIRHNEVSGYSLAVSNDDSKKIKEKIQAFYDMFDKHLKGWAEFVLNLKVPQKYEGKKEDFLYSLSKFYDYFSNLHKLSEEGSKNPYKAIIILNALQILIQKSILIYSDLLTPIANMDKKINDDSMVMKKSMEALGNAIELFKVFLYEKDAKTRAWLCLKVTPPEPPLLNPEDLVEEDAPPQATPEKMGPPERAVLVLRTADIPQNTIHGVPDTTRMIELEAADISGLQLDLTHSYNFNRYGRGRDRQPSPAKVLKPLNEFLEPVAKAIPPMPSNGGYKAFWDNIIEQVDPGATRIDAELPGINKAVNFTKTDVVLVVIDVRHSLEQQTGFMDFLKQNIGHSAPIILTASTNAVSDRVIYDQIKELEKETGVHYIPNFSLNNFLLLITTLRQVMRNGVANIKIPSMESDAEVDAAQLDAISSFWTKNVTKALRLDQCVKSVNDQRRGRAIPILPPRPPFKEIMDSSLRLFKKFRAMRPDQNTKLENALASLKLFGLQLVDVTSLLLIYQKMKTDGDIVPPTDLTQPALFEDMLKLASDLRMDLIELINALLGKKSGGGGKLSLIHEE